VTLPVGFNAPGTGLITALSLVMPPMPTVGVLDDNVVLDGAGAAIAGAMVPNSDAATTPKPSPCSVGSMVRKISGQ
jgi:hypothetical protein